MRIGIDARCLMNKNYSGVSWYAFNLLKAIFELDQKNQYLLFYNSAKPVAFPEFGRENVRPVGFKYPNKIFNLAVNFLNWPKIDQLIGGVDILFVPNLHFISWSGNCRKILVVHDLSFLRFPEFFTFKSQWWHQLILAKRILNQADLVIADSKNTRNDLVELLEIKPEKIKVVYPGIGKKFRKFSDESFEMVKQKYDLPAEFVLFLGTLEPRKNVENVIRACQGRNLVIAGGRGWRDKKILKMIGKNQQIKYLGYINEEDKPALYNLASCLVYPSFYEGFGLPIVEAMACGCPVVCGANSSQAEVAGEAALLVDPYNVNEIKNAVELIMGDAELRQRFSEAGIERAKMFSWERTGREVMDLFRK
ncbi:MAG: glycosyltransferase family 1 protein [Patescibacteria group bacterium]